MTRVGGRKFRCGWKWRFLSTLAFILVVVLVYYIRWEVPVHVLEAMIHLPVHYAAFGFKLHTVFYHLFPYFFYRGCTVVYLWYRIWTLWLSICLQPLWSTFEPVLTVTSYRRSPLSSGHVVTTPTNLIFFYYFIDIALKLLVIKEAF